MSSKWENVTAESAAGREEAEAGLRAQIYSSGQWLRFNAQFLEKNRRVKPGNRSENMRSGCRGNVSPHRRRCRCGGLLQVTHHPSFSLLLFVYRRNTANDPHLNITQLQWDWCPLYLEQSRLMTKDETIFNLKAAYLHTKKPKCEGWGVKISAQ